MSTKPAQYFVNHSNADQSIPRKRLFRLTPLSLAHLGTLARPRQPDIEWAFSCSRGIGLGLKNISE